MEFSQVFILLFSVFLCCYFPSLHCSRLHYYSKQPHFGLVSQISIPPSPAPEAAFPSPPVSSSDSAAIFNVLSFGAVGNGDTDDTQAFKMAWDAACQVESAVLLVPNQYSFMLQSTIFTGPCKNGLVFQVMWTFWWAETSADVQDWIWKKWTYTDGDHIFIYFSKIDGTLMPPDGPDSWPKNNSKRQWLVFYRINGMSMQGGGLIDGRGEKWWNLPCKPHKVSTLFCYSIWTISIYKTYCLHFFFCWPMLQGSY